MARRVRRFWSDEDKRRIVAQSYAPGVSVSVVARRYDVDSNLIFAWRRDLRYKPGAEDTPSFLPVEVEPDPSSPLEPAGSSEGRTEIALSNGHRVIETARLNHVDPQAWLIQVLDRIISCRPCPLHRRNVIRSHHVQYAACFCFP